MVNIPKSKPPVGHCEFTQFARGYASSATVTATDGMRMLNSWLKTARMQKNSTLMTQARVVDIGDESLTLEYGLVLASKWDCLDEV